MIVRSSLLALLLACTSPALAVEAAAPSSTEVLFEQQFPLTRGTLAKDFPRDLVALQREFAEIDSTEISPQLKLQRAFLSLTGLRKIYAPKLQFARTDLSALVVLSLSGFYDAVLRNEGTAVCNGFAIDGAATLYTLGLEQRYGLDLDRQAAAYFSAVASAFEDPDVVGPASEADWKQVMGRIVSEGHPASYVVSIAAANRNDPDLCPAVSALLHAMVAVKSDAAPRVRAEFIQGTTGY